ncbi:hypothetical protein DERP_006619 [Dermatophagoides pteronyssinus]|uniref:Uncharacterized protein n=1 Tax=Dermatophagoides pteronyssinus TaxID=6956 RepID=A0ABQ8IQP9_DERPT|nr:hypothetical protein DERP_006619 [Dermatophagoides pteronyssinus]
MFTINFNLIKLISFFMNLYIFFERIANDYLHANQNHDGCNEFYTNSNFNRIFNQFLSDHSILIDNENFCTLFFLHNKENFPYFPDHNLIYNPLLECCYNCNGDSIRFRNKFQLTN